jgi:hypothetical protein
VEGAPDHGRPHESDGHAVAPAIVVELKMPRTMANASDTLFARKKIQAKETSANVPAICRTGIRRTPTLCLRSPRRFCVRIPNTRYVPCSAPQITNVQLAPCHSPLTTKTIIRLSR